MGTDLSIKNIVIIFYMYHSYRIKDSRMAEYESMLTFDISCDRILALSKGCAGKVSRSDSRIEA